MMSLTTFRTDSSASCRRDTKGDGFDSCALIVAMSAQSLLFAPPSDSLFELQTRLQTPKRGSAAPMFALSSNVCVVLGPPCWHVSVTFKR